jgi:hypothetical protein
VRKCPLYLHISVGADLVSARVSGSHPGNIIASRHKIGPYDVVW